jgi:hypothetical protein
MILLCILSVIVRLAGIISMSGYAKNKTIVSFFHLLLTAASGYYRACRVWPDKYCQAAQ